MPKIPITNEQLPPLSGAEQEAIQEDLVYQERSPVLDLGRSLSLYQIFLIKLAKFVGCIYQLHH